MPPTPAAPRIVALADLANAYHVPDYMPVDWRILMLPGDLIVDGDLLLDWDRPRDANAASQHYWRDAVQHPASDPIDGLAIEGSLHISGALINLTDGPILLVRDHLHVRSLIAGGSFIRIRGDADVSDTVLGHTNHGELHIDGTVTAPLLIWDDHLFNAGTLSPTHLRHPRSRVGGLGIRRRH